VARFGGETVTRQGLPGPSAPALRREEPGV